MRLRAEADALDSETVSAAENLDHVIQNLNRKFAEGPRAATRAHDARVCVRVSSTVSTDEYCEDR